MTNMLILKKLDKISEASKTKIC